MAKPKKPTPQEIYMERKRKEEAERDAYLPPGMINHGNTCFMNSTLQALIATPPLDSLFHFQTLSPVTQASSDLPIQSQRSPLLTNAHGVAGEFEQEHTDGMPLGDSFAENVLRAWSIRDQHRRESMSPKEILNAIGKKYDQYLDFAQQDAHEFLRQLLDAMRMEEMDIIKKRQPPPPKVDKRSKSKSDRARSPAFNPNLSVVREASVDSLGPSGPVAASPSQSTSTSTLALITENSDTQPTDPAGSATTIRDEDQLRTFADMIFGGTLASILVCDACKKISVTKEEFNDLSLPIKPEEYAKASATRKEKFRKFAQKLKLPKRGGEKDDKNTGKDELSADEAGPMLPPGLPPPLPIQHLGAFRASSVPPSPMRRDSDVAAASTAPDIIHPNPRRRSIDASGPTGGLRELAAAAASVPAGPQSAGPSSLGSTSVSGQSDVGTISAAQSVETVQTSVEDPDEKHARGRVGFVDRDPPSSKKEKEKGKEKEKEKDVNDNWAKFARRVSLVVGRKNKDSDSQSKERGRSRQSIDLSRDKLDLVISRPTSTTNALPQDAKQGPKTSGLTSPPTRGHSPLPNVDITSPPLLAPVPVKPSADTPTPIPIISSHVSPLSKAEAAYLRRILADVPGSTPNPLAFLLGTGKPSPDISGSSGPALWSRVTQLTTVEECLRMFTAVEVLENENMVGCRRCWKLAHGMEIKKKNVTDDADGDDADSEADEKDETDSPKDATSGKIISPLPSPPIPFVMPSNMRMDSARSMATDWSSVASGSNVGTPHESASDVDRKAFYLQPTQGNLPIPVISTTAPDTPGTRSFDPNETQLSSLPSTTGSLLAPAYRRRRAESITSDSDSGIIEFDGPSEASSANGTPAASPNSSVEHLPQPRRKSSSGSKSKQVIHRRAYKRYLIATPPPVLVIHFKRFQQISPGMPSFSFGLSGFKKLDDFVAFPEYLDLSPFLAPSKEEYGLRDKHSKRTQSTAKIKESQGKCRYRLYAVVEHLGTMLGGHYIAYTALPTKPHSAISDEKPQDESPKTSKHPEKQASNPPRQWAYISDTIVRLTSLDEVLKAKAYMCMYERI